MDPSRSPAELVAFEEALEHLRNSEWSDVYLREATPFVGEFFHATMTTGDVLVLSFGMKPPVAAFFVLYAGSPDGVSTGRAEE